MAVTRRGAARRAAIALAAVAFLAVAGPARGQYLSAYKAGLDAIDAQDWPRAAGFMAEAIAERGDEKMKLPVRFFLRPYVPHFHLGYARFNVGDCAGALAAWAESERQGVLAKLPEADVARRGREECDQRTRQRVLSQARQEARQALSRASAAAAALLDRSRDEHTRDLWEEGDPSPSALHDEGLETLRAAEKLLGDDGVEPEAILRAEALGRSAVAHFAALDTEVDRLTAASRDAAAAKAESIDARVAEAKLALARTAHLAPYPLALRKARADLEGLVAEAQRREEASRAYLDGLAARLRSSISSLEKLGAAPPEALHAAAESYLHGRHDQVVAALAQARFDDRRARAHASLLLAASRHALYLEGGELDTELLAAAASDARACRDSDARLSPTGRFFSPRFVAFFEESLATPSG